MPCKRLRAGAEAAFITTQSSALREKLVSTPKPVISFHPSGQSFCAKVLKWPDKVPKHVQHFGELVDVGLAGYQGLSQVELGHNAAEGKDIDCGVIGLRVK